MNKINIKHTEKEKFTKNQKYLYYFIIKII